MKVVVVVLQQQTRALNEKLPLAKAMEKSYERWFWVKWAADESLEGRELSQGSHSITENHAFTNWLNRFS